MTHPDVLGVLLALMRHRRASRREVEEFQDRHLRRLIAHAHERVPYYRKLFERVGFKPSDLHGLADLRRIPISSKKDLQATPAQDLVARGLDPQSLISSRTSGSSGVPFTIRRTWLEQNLLHLFRLRALRDIGVQATDRIASVVYVRKPHPRDSKVLGRALRGLRRYRRFPIDVRQEPREIIQELRGSHPDVVSGFSGALARVALYMNAADRQDIRPRLVLTGGEVLTPLMRRQIVASFEAPVFETYGSHEFNLLAWECARSGDLHTCDDALILEVVRDADPVATGERGEVVATALHSYAMPFIRFRLGDLVTQGPETCACGQPFATIRSIQGRMLDLFPLPEGRSIHPGEIVTRLLDFSWIRQFQLLQEKIDRVVLRLVPFEVSTEELTRLRATVSAILGPDVKLEILLVEEISLEDTGKFRVSRSLVHSDYDEIHRPQS